MYYSQAAEITIKFLTFIARIQYLYSAIFGYIRMLRQIAE